MFVPLLGAESGSDWDCAPSESDAWWWGQWRLQKAISWDDSSSLILAKE